jgi:hypothetical protein
MLDLKKAVTKVDQPLRAVMNPKVVTSLALILVAVAEPSLAADFDLPSVDIAGVDSDSTATEIVVAIIKYAFKMALWIFVLIAGAVFIKNTVKSVAKVRKDEDGKWGDVIGEITGNAVVVILIIALATWVSSLLN